MNRKVFNLPRLNPVNLALPPFIAPAFHPAISPATLLNGSGILYEIAEFATEKIIYLLNKNEKYKEINNLYIH